MPDQKYPIRDHAYLACPAQISETAQTFMEDESLYSKFNTDQRERQLIRNHLSLRGRLRSVRVYLRASM
jgi:hypothetical protein